MKILVQTKALAIAAVFDKLRLTITGSISEKRGPKGNAQNLTYMLSKGEDLTCIFS